MTISPLMRAALAHVPTDWEPCGWQAAGVGARTVDALHNQGLVELKRIRNRWHYRRTKAGDEAAA